jgi:hypothetical protein
MDMDMDPRERRRATVLRYHANGRTPPGRAKGSSVEGGSSFSVEEALRRWDFTSQHALAQEFLASQMAHI